MAAHDSTRMSSFWVLSALGTPFLRTFRAPMGGHACARGDSKNRGFRIVCGKGGGSAASSSNSLADAAFGYRRGSDSCARAIDFPRARRRTDADFLRGSFDAFHNSISERRSGNLRSFMCVANDDEQSSSLRMHKRVLRSLPSSCRGDRFAGEVRMLFQVSCIAMFRTSLAALVASRRQRNFVWWHHCACGVI